jgi:hypothetical protein
MKPIYRLHSYNNSFVLKCFNIFDKRLMYMGNKICTDFLFPNANLLTGVASAINVVGNFYEFNTSQSPKEADSKAIECDWMMIGRDFEIALEKQSTKLEANEFIAK